VLCPFVLSATREQTTLGAANKTREMKFHDEKKSGKNPFFSPSRFFVRGPQQSSRRVVQPIKRFFQSHRGASRLSQTDQKQKRRGKKKEKKKKEKKKKKKKKTVEKKRTLFLAYNNTDTPGSNVRGARTPRLLGTHRQKVKLSCFCCAVGDSRKIL
jgi:hypothetical protein